MDTQAFQHLLSLFPLLTLRRYRCKQCQRTCSVLTKTPMARLRKAECWEDYAQALIDGLTVRQAAARCGVCKNTAFLCIFPRMAIAQ